MDVVRAGRTFRASRFSGAASAGSAAVGGGAAGSTFAVSGLRVRATGGGVTTAADSAGGESKTPLMTGMDASPPRAETARIFTQPDFARREADAPPAVIVAEPARPNAISVRTRVFSGLRYEEPAR